MVVINKLWCYIFRNRHQKTAKKKEEKMFIAESEKMLRKSMTSNKTNENSRTALRSFMKFCNRDDIPISSITATLIEHYERWLWDKGVTRNTSAAYMRSLRALYNKVAKGKQRRVHPFTRVVTSCQPTQKRAISTSDIQAVAKYSTSNKQQELSRDLFLFSFYCMGMPFIDIAHLKKNQIRGDTLTYRRQKTGVEIVMHLEPEAESIIQKYSDPKSPYVFPILTLGRETQKTYRSSLSLHNKYLRNLENTLSLSVRLSSYVPRHTWATLAYHESGDLQLVSSAIGHSSPKITHTYIKPLSGGKTAVLNRKLISLVNKNTYAE